MPHGGVLTITAGVKKIEDGNLRQKNLCKPESFRCTILVKESIRTRCVIFSIPFIPPRKRGTGLGLAIAHSIIKHHHGMIKVKSSPQTGTTFDVILPLKQ
jgi:hypothetical protein